MTIKNADRQFILEFIEVYRSLPALWDTKCKEYTNRGKKNEQYDVLIEKYRENFPDANKQEVVKKNNSLRTNFRKELKRIRDTEQSGAGAEDVEPSLWYFNEMKFLQNLETPTASTSTMNNSGPPLSDNLGNGDSDKTRNDERATSEGTTAFGPPNKKKKKGDVSKELMEMTCKRLQNPPDEYDTIAAAWAVELKKIEPSQQLFAKKAIHDILFEGQMGTLSRDSVVIIIS